MRLYNQQMTELGFEPRQLDSYPATYVSCIVLCPDFLPWIIFLHIILKDVFLFPYCTLKSALIKLMFTGIDRNSGVGSSIQKRKRSAAKTHNVMDMKG
jgi:hypothetical protein